MFKKLYRYRFDPVTSEVIEIAVFKRIRNADTEYEQLRRLSPRRMVGTSTTFCGKTYDVYGLYHRGYMFYARASYGDDQTAETERLYFAFEKYEKKGR